MNDKKEETKYYCTNCGQIIDRPDYCIYCCAGADKIVPYEEEEEEEN